MVQCTSDKRAGIQLSLKGILGCYKFCFWFECCTGVMLIFWKNRIHFHNGSEFKFLRWMQDSCMNDAPSCLNLDVDYNDNFRLCKLR